MSQKKSAKQMLTPSQQAGGSDVTMLPAGTAAVDNASRAREVVETIVTLLELFGFDRTGYATRPDTEHWTRLINSSGDWMKAAKYKIAAYYQVHRRDELLDPTLPQPPFSCADNSRRLLGGRAGRFMGKLLKRGVEKRTEFLQSVLLLKTGFSRDYTVLKPAAKKTLKALVTKRERIGYTFIDSRRRWGHLRFRDIVQEVRRTAREVFGNFRFSTGDLLSKLIMPSLSANYIRSRSHLGTFGELFSLGLFSPSPILPTGEVLEQGEIRAVHLPGVLTHEEEHRSNAPFRPSFVLTGINGCRDQFVKTYFDSLKLARAEEPVATPVALAEALKTRVITKGPPLTQYCLKPLQKFFHGILRAHPIFQLVGTPATAEIVERVLGERLRDGEGFVSGDYSDATNQLDPQLSNAAWEEMCNVCEVPEALKQLGFRVLTGHLLEDEEGILHVQQWGQLMGSIVSFPVLCLVNAAICRMAIEHDRNRTLSLRRLPLLINGDDCAFRVTSVGYAFWGAVGRMAGLQPSIGKVYYSEKFVNINSTNFSYHGAEGLSVGSDEFSYRVWYTETKRIRLGLILGLKRSEASEGVKSVGARVAGDEEFDNSLGSRHAQLLRDAPVECRAAVDRLFKRKNAEALSCGLPWYVPQCYGGLGLQEMPELGESHTASRLDRLIVTAMVHWRLWSAKQPKMPEQIKACSATQIHKVAKEILNESLPLSLPVRWVLEDSADVDGLDVPDLDLFVVYMRPDRVEALEDGGAAQRTIDRNKRVWAWFNKHVKSFGWLNPFDILKARRLVTDVDILTEQGRIYQATAVADPAFPDVEFADPWL